MMNVFTLFNRWKLNCLVAGKAQPCIELDASDFAAFRSAVLSEDACGRIYQAQDTENEIWIGGVRFSKGQDVEKAYWAA